LKRKLTYLLLFSLLILCFKGCIYRGLVSYSPLSVQSTDYIITNDSLKNYIDRTVAEDKPLDAEDATEMSLEITAHFLSFRTSRTANDPNRSCSTGRAHCVGYSAFFNSTLNYISQKQGLKLKATHVRGKISFLGVDLNSLSDSPFWADHDYNSVTAGDGAKLYTDPTLYDYSGIAYISQPE
jgi:hypothetical protein